MIRVGEQAALESVESMRCMRDAGIVDVAQSTLPAVCAGNPSEEMVERSIFHRHHDDMIDAAGFRLGIRVIRVPTTQYGRSRCSCDLREKLATRDHHLLYSLSLALEDNEKPAADWALACLIRWTIHYLSIDDHRGRAPTVKIHRVICSKLHHRLRQLHE